MNYTDEICLSYIMKYIYIYIYIHICLCVYIFIYMYVYVLVYIYIYIHFGNKRQKSSVPHAFADVVKTQITLDCQIYQNLLVGFASMACCTMLESMVLGLPDLV